MLKVENLKVRYGMIEAIKGISFEVRDGEIVTLIGANGAGKTTTMHAISGLIKAAEGSITLDGQELTKIPAHKSWAWDSPRSRREDAFLPSRPLKKT